MDQFGKFQFRYIPAETGDYCVDPSITLQVSAEADLNDLVRVFEQFLLATGYALDSKELRICNKFHTDTTFKGYAPAQPYQTPMVAVGNPEAVTLGLNLGK
jgi:hypothetical protein